MTSPDHRAFEISARQRLRHLCELTWQNLVSDHEGAQYHLGPLRLLSRRLARNLLLLIFPAGTPGLLLFDEQALRDLADSRTRLPSEVVVPLRHFVREVTRHALDRLERDPPVDEQRIERVAPRVEVQAARLPRRLSDPDPPQLLVKRFRGLALVHGLVRVHAVEHETVLALAGILRDELSELGRNEGGDRHNARPPCFCRPQAEPRAPRVIDLDVL